jgi:RNA-directed DNA polymerase
MSTMHLRAGAAPLIGADSCRISKNIIRIKRINAQMQRGRSLRRSGGELAMLPLLQRMSAGMELSVFTLAELARTAPHRYKVFTIPKRNGDPRIIAQPARVIKEIQRWLVSEELAYLPIHEAAMAYTPGSKIRKNAEIHAKNSFLLKMDFENFFPSISHRDVSLHLKKYGEGRWDEQEIGVITRLVLWLPKRTKYLQLCIGGPSSPLISNTVMYDFDLAVSELGEVLELLEKGLGCTLA